MEIFSTIEKLVRSAVASVHAARIRNQLQQHSDEDFAPRAATAFVG
jgi:hypothetical protein